MVRIAISALDAAVDAFGIKSMLDAACGDADWIARHFLSRRPELAYTGADIVKHVIEQNKQSYPSLRFIVADLGCSERPDDPGPELPKVDLIFSKETLNHMFVPDAVQALLRMRRTGARYFLTNITRGAPNNRGAVKWTHANYAQYDYELPPFNLRKLCTLSEVNKDDWTEFAMFDLQH
eukprot:gnl/TRDRNA2_/TRDRNA2_127531_c1_seq1.p1 gnl/TRDRNA2_/TRDRNA2_127531_c1~~gnl/TRDRNA2_/TRDRNA2_127531_c1_seq1.p1  ORF type:complete len:192 (-),score=31.59 gnl/TRDRNA2_/TRDRNA2_127531_c1_seq1:39-575(-)